MNIDLFQINLARVLAHTMLLEAKGPEPMGVAWAVNVGAESVAAFFGDKAKVPKFTPINIGAEADKAIAGNVARFGDVSKLGSKVNTFNQDELEKMMERALPGYKSMTGDITTQIASMLKGQVPQDVTDAIGRSGAWQSMSGGYGGSGMGRNLVARDLGRTSLDIMEKGVDAGMRWLTTAKNTMTAPQFDATSMFLTPEQQIQGKMFNTTGQFQRDWMKSQVDAQNDPVNLMGKGAETTTASL